MGALISYNNLGDSAILTNNSDGSEVLTEANVQVRQLGKPFRQNITATSPLESAILDFDFSTAKSISYVGIFGHNITDGTYAVDLGTSEGASDVASASGTLWQGVVDDPKQQHVLLGATYSARYLRVTLTPSNGVDVDVGRIWIDDPLVIPVGLEFEQTVRDDSQSNRSIGASKYAYERPRYRVTNLIFNNLTEAQALGDSSDNTAKSVHHMDMTVGTHAPLVILPETSGADAQQVIHKLGCYGSIANSTPLRVMPAKDGSGGWRYRKQFTFEEER